MQAASDGLNHSHTALGIKQLKEEGARVLRSLYRLRLQQPQPLTNLFTIIPPYPDRFRHAGRDRIKFSLLPPLLLRTSDVHCLEAGSPVARRPLPAVCSSGLNRPHTPAPAGGGLPVPTGQHFPGVPDPFHQLRRLKHERVFAPAQDPPFDLLQTTQCHRQLHFVSR